MPYDSSQFPPFAVTVDVVALCPLDNTLGLVLVPRLEEPYLGLSALPGTFVRINEDLIDAAHRVLKTKAGVENIYLEQLFTVGRPGRDPRMRVVTVAYLALSPTLSPTPPARIVPLLSTPNQPRKPAEALAFDHEELITIALKRLRGKLNYTDVGLRLLPDTFTLRDAQTIWERILESPLNKDSFRRWLLASGMIRPTADRQQEVGHRPAVLFTRSTGEENG
jgi:8-oxo-dGTP diphosphatase